MNELHFLNAGAVLQEHPQLDDVAIDPLEARSYDHPAFSSPMIRLSPEAVATGLDLEMELLGFDVPKQAPKVGFVRRQKLGFPGWCLVHDPKNARFALEVVKELKKAARRIASKPGAARDAMDGIGLRLARSVPHFLPSYYEQCARSFVEGQNLTYAQQFFEKARAAEREYALELNLELREQTFVDFALAGALSVKSLNNLAKELAAQGEQGLESYLRICVRRTTGGLPPSPGMLKDLTALSKAAKVEPNATLARFFEQVLGSPALGRVTPSFFKKAKKAIALLSERPEVRTQLLDLYPSVGSEWLALLNGWGCLDALVDPELDGQSERPVAKWFGDAISGGIFPELAALFLKANKRIAAEGNPVPVRQSWRTGVWDVEFCLAHGIDVGEVQSFDVRGYIQDEQAPDVPCIAANQGLRTQLIESLRSRRSFNDAAGASVNRPHFDGLLADAMAQAFTPTGKPLPAVLRILDGLEKLDAALWKRYPLLQEAAAKLDVAEALARTLQIGHPTEWHWPLFEAAGTALGELQVRDQGDCVLFHSNVRVQVLRSDGELLADLRPKLAKNEKILDALWFEGDVLMLTGQWRGDAIWWASRPDLRKPTEFYTSFPEVHWDAEGRCIFGEVELRPGMLPSKGRGLTFDGEKFYRWTDEGARVFEPHTGKVGEMGFPNFLDAGPDEKGRKRRHAGALFARRGAAAGRAIRGLGSGDFTCYGYRWLGSRNAWNVEDLAGGSVSAESTGQPFYVPGSEALRLWRNSWSGGSVSSSLGLGCDDESGFHRGRRDVPPWECWRHFEPVAEGFSKKLRKASRDPLEGIVALAAGAECRQHETQEDKDWKPASAVLDAVRGTFGECADESLLWWVAGVVHVAGVAAARCAEFQGGQSAVQTAKVSRSRQQELSFHYLALIHQESRAALECDSELGRLRERLDGDGPAFDLVDDKMDLWQLFGFANSVLFRIAATAPGANEHRPALEKLARTLVSEGFEAAAAAGRVRWARSRSFSSEVQLSTDGDINWLREPERHTLVWMGRRAWRGADSSWELLEFAPPEGFQKIPSEHNRAGPGGCTAPDIDAFLALVSERGPLPVQEAAVLVSAELGLSPVEAQVWLSAELAGGALEGDAVECARAFFGAQLNLNAHGAQRLARELAMELMGDDPAGLWEPEVFAQRGVAAWTSRFEKVPALGADHDATVPAPGGVFDFGGLARLGLPGSEGVRTDLKFDEERWFDKKGFQKRGFGSAVPSSHLRWMLQALWEFPASSALFRSVPAAWALVRERLRAPTFFHSLGNLRWVLDGRDAIEERLRLFGTEIPEHLWRGPRPPQNGPSKLPSGDGDFVVVPDPGLIWAHPLALIERTNDPRIAAMVRPHYGLVPEFTMLLGERGDECIAFAKRVAGQDGVGADPRVSAPEAVARVGAHFNLEPDAAALYLMLAVLRSPMDRHVRRYVGYSKAKHDAAGKALLEAGLVIEAKRTGAGRKLFLPGAWDKHQRWEVWKEPLIRGGDPSHPAHGVEPTLMSRSPDVLYGIAAERLETDPPKFEEPPKAR